MKYLLLLLLIVFTLPGCKAEPQRTEYQEEIKTPVVQEQVVPSGKVRVEPAVVIQEAPIIPDDKKVLLEDLPDEESSPAVAEFDALKEEDYTEAEFDSLAESGNYEAEFDNIPPQQEAEFDTMAEQGQYVAEFDSIEEPDSIGEFDAIEEGQAAESEFPEDEAQQQ